MNSPIRRLVRNDQVRHGGSRSTSNADGVGVDEGGAVAPSSFDLLVEMNEASITVAEAVDAPNPSLERATTEAPVAGQGSPPKSQDVGPPSSAHQDEAKYADIGVQEDIETAPALIGTPAQATAPNTRPAIVDVLTSLCPVFRAAHVFPGTQVPSSQLADAVAQMTRQVVSLSHALARDADPLEIDQSWMRARMGTFVSELVASTWISSVLTRQRVEGAQSVMDPEGDIQRLAACVDGAMHVIEQEPLSAGPGSRVAAVVAMLPLVYHLEQYAHFLRRALPDVVLDLDGAAARIGEALADEVSAAVERLSPYVPETSRFELASELMAHGAKFAFDARETASSEVFAALHALGSQEEPESKALALLQSDELQGGVPVDRTILLMRTMFRRAVATIEHSAKTMLGNVP